MESRSGIEPWPFCLSTSLTPSRSAKPTQNAQYVQCCRCCRKRQAKLYIAQYVQCCRCGRDAVSREFSFHWGRQGCCIHSLSLFCNTFITVLRLAQCHTDSLSLFCNTFITVLVLCNDIPILCQGRGINKQGSSLITGLKDVKRTHQQRRESPTCNSHLAACE